jgi:NAD(P)-dependent dehydrogenase (short-subunit alcohol dehydrogenase family)
VFDTNYFGSIRTTQQFFRLLQGSTQPHIINISSEVGSLTMHSSPDRNSNWDLYHAYGSSKVALNSFTVLLANELRSTKFRVNSVTPGYTATDLNQHRGYKTVEEGAKAIVKLVTESCVETGKFFKEGGEVPW